MSDDKHTIKVSLNTAAKPPVTVSRNVLELKHKGTHKVVWKAADGTPAFGFNSLTIGGTTFSNPTSGGSPKAGSALSDIDVADKKMSLKDKVDGVVEFPYVLTVKVGDAIYSTATAQIDDEGGTPRIRNEA